MKEKTGFSEMDVFFLINWPTMKSIKIVQTHSFY